VFTNQPDDIEPTDFAKNVLVNCGYLKSRKESAQMLRKGSGYLRLLDSSPNYGPHARETYYGKLISDDGSMHMLSTTKVGVVNIEDRNRLKFRSNSQLNQDSALGFSELGSNRLTTDRNQTSKMSAKSPFNMHQTGFSSL
jgi:aryl-alcohol dehydrogenase-like predicted oxidoreductase